MDCELMLGVGIEGACDHCAEPLTGRRRRWCSDECSRWYSRNHAWSFARPAALARDDHRCVRCGADWRSSLEVNHIIPREGRGYGPGCHHHLDNLETLCHEHHVEVTNQQRIARRNRQMEPMA